MARSSSIFRAVAIISVSTLLSLPPHQATAADLPVPSTQANVDAGASAPLDLNTALDLAASGNSAVISARRVYEQAVARVDQARAQTRLSISFTSAASESNADVPQPPPAHETFGTIQNSLNVPLPVGRKPSLAVSQAEAQAAAALANFEGARRTLLAQVIADYYDLLKKEAQLRDAQENLAQAQRQQEETTLRNRAGDVPDLDVIRAGTPVAAAQSALIQAQTATEIARQTLNAALGRPLVAATVLGELDAAPPISIDQNEALRVALDRSPEIRAARFNIDAARLGVENAKLWRSPALSLQASDLRSGDVTSFSREDTVGATVTLPLTDGGLASGQRREAEAALQQAQADLTTATVSAQTTATSAYLTARSARDVAEANKTALDIAQTAYDKSTLGYKNGLYPLTDVLSAQAVLVQARSAYTQSLYDAAAADAQINLLVGRLAPDPGAGKLPK